MNGGGIVLRACLFISAVRFLSASDQCPSKIEMGLLIDTSSSYGEGEQWTQVGQLFNDFLGFYNISPNGTLLNVITFSQEVKILFRHHNSSYQNHDAAVDAIIASLADTQPSSHPWTERALIKAHDVFFTKESLRQWKVLFVFTRGRTPNPILYSRLVGSIEAKGVNIVVVSWDKEEAVKIAGKRGHAIYVESISDALQKLPEIVGKTCLINGGYTDWTPWGTCSQTCGGGQQNRKRNCSNPVPSEQGKNCDDLGPSQDTRPCNSQPCGDIDGGYSQWTAWSVCSHTCGGGKAVRHRLCANPPKQENGQPCDVLGPHVDTKACKTKKCKWASKEPCEQGLDLAILLDQSKSISKRGLELVLRTFLPDFIDMLKISKTKTRVAFLRFHQFSHINFNFANGAFHSREALKDFFLNFDIATVRKTRIDRGLLSAFHEAFTPRAGDRKSKQNVLLVLTDGRPYPPKVVVPFNTTVSSLKAGKKVHIVSVGYGRDNRIRREVLEEIGGNNVLVMNRSDTGDSGYKQYVPQVQEMVCNVDGGYTQWSMWSSCSVSCGAGTQIRSKICTAPPPRVRGMDCQGDFSEVRACGKVYCPAAPAKCRNQVIDLAVVLETSTQLGIEHFVHGREFIKQFFNLMNISLNSTHVSFVLFNKRPYSVISFDKAFYQSNDAVSAVLEFLPPLLKPGKRLDLALRYLNSTVFTEASGDRPGNKNVAVIITDGFVNKGREKDVSDAISALKSNNVKLLTISTDRVNIREEVLYQIAGTNMLLCSSLEELTASVEKIASIACDV